ncbi:MAG TPA: hypothetical protein VFO41_11980, partial [Alphaproteobacteria bacterium]|nr:hypothetical protein [Alphaproteobacteria bacterium]
TVSNVTFNTTHGRQATIFAKVGAGAVLQHLRIVNETVSADALRSDPEGGIAGQNDGTISDVIADVHITITDAYDEEIGGLVGLNSGLIEESSTTGTIMTPDSVNTFVGGLVGQGGVIDRSHSAVSVQSADYGAGLVAEPDTVTNSYATGDVTARRAGGLAADLHGHKTIERSFATGAVTASQYGGGLIGHADFANNVISDCYSTGSVTGTTDADALGGLAGGENAAVTNFYATGAIGGPAGAATGGVTGQDLGATSVANYWDLDTTGVSDPHKGAGNIVDDPGMTGLSDPQLKSGLPAGFDPQVWAQSPAINNGYPYLIANPPPQ